MGKRQSRPNAPKSNHYVDNDKFLTELLIHRESVLEYKKNLAVYHAKVLAGEDHVKPIKPRASDYIGTCFILIAERLSKRPNFAGYVFVEEMIGDAIENCIMYVDSFDPEKSKNPFAYFTQIVFFAFIRRITKEKKQLYVKLKIFQDQDKKGYFAKFLAEKTKTVDESNHTYVDVDASLAAYASFLNLSETDVKNYQADSKKDKKEKEKDPTE